MTAAVEYVSPAAANERRRAFQQRIADAAEKLKADKFREAVKSLGELIPAPIVAVEAVESIAPSAPAEEPKKHADLSTPELEALRERLTRQLADVENRLDVCSDATPRPTLNHILRVVAKYYGVTVDDIRSARRTAPIVRPRQVAAYIAKSLTLFSLPAIGRHFGGRDHTTILHAVRKIAALILTDQAIAIDVAFLLEKITGKQQ